MSNTKEEFEEQNTFIRFLWEEAEKLKRKIWKKKLKGLDKDSSMKLY